MRSGIKHVCASLFVILFLGSSIAARAEGFDIRSLNIGVTAILEADKYLNEKEISELVKKNEVHKEVEEESDLVMADVKSVLNVRSEPSEDAKKAGKLYKDCGGRILERKDGWTLLESGELVGWVSDEYLLFGDEAEALAEEVGNTVAKVEADALRVRKEPSQTAGIYGMLAHNDETIVIEDDEHSEDWVCIEFEGEKGYVSTEFVTVGFKIDEGETIETINKREKEEAERKAKLTANRGAVSADVSEAELLAALIQCEAGNQPYEGMLAVGAVVMNRVRSGAYPNTIYSVIFASGQFTPALNGKVAKTLEKGPKESCRQAAQEAINGATNVGGATHFRRVGYRDGIVIGSHVFW